MNRSPAPVRPDRRGNLLNPPADAARSANRLPRPLRKGRTPGGRRGFYGWRIVAFSALAMALSAPGQTHGVSLFIDPLIADLEISRTQISTAYLTGTLIGACAMPAVGKAVDRYGPRWVMAAIGAVIGAILLALSFVTGVVGLTAGFVGIRMAGHTVAKCFCCSASPSGRPDHGAHGAR